MIKHSVKYNQRHIQLFLLELFQPRLNINLKFISSHRFIHPMQLCGEVNGSLQRFINTPDLWSETPLGNLINGLVTPVFLMLVDKPIFKEP